MRLHLVPGLGAVKLRHLAAQHVQRFIHESSDAGKGPRTIQLSVAVLRIALADAERWNLVHRNVARLVKTPRARPDAPRPFSEAELRRLFANAQEERLYPLIVTAHASGLRISELLGFQWHPDIDLEHGLIRLSFQLGSLNREREPLKTEASKRTIPLPSSVVHILRIHRQKQLQMRHESIYWDDHGLVFSSNVGTPLSQRNVHREWTRILKSANVTHRGIHQLRHTYATSLAEIGINERAAQQLLGHADSRTTRQIYTHTTDRMMDVAAEMIDDHFETVFGSFVQPTGSHFGSHRHEVEVNANGEEE